MKIISTEKDSGESVSISMLITRLKFKKSLFRVTLQTIFTTIIALILFRNFFTKGMLTYTDFFEIFQALPSTSGYYLYFSAWNPSNFGIYNYIMVPRTAIFSLLSIAGVYGVLSEEITLYIFMIVAGLSLGALVYKFTHSIICQVLSTCIYFLTPMFFIEIFNASGSLIFFSFAPLILLSSFSAFVENRRLHYLLLPAIISILPFFNPYSLVYSFPIVALTYVVSLINFADLRSFLSKTLLILFTFTFALISNAPYFLGNLVIFLGSGFSGLSSNSAALLSPYQWSTPFRTWTLLDAYDFPRYAIFYPNSDSILLIIPALISLMALAIKWHVPHSLQTRVLLGSLLFGSYTFIVGIHFGLISDIFNFIPVLFVDNYPERFSIILNLVYSILPPVLVSELLHSRNFKKCNHSKIHIFQIKFVEKFKYNPGSIRMLAASCIVIILVLSTVLPAMFYLSSGNFKVNEVDKQMQIPSEWPVYASPSFYGIMKFLKLHNGLTQDRPLILPYPGEAGSGQFINFGGDLFNLPEYSGPIIGYGSVGGGISSSEYATAVMNALISNSTNMIGIPLGIASVRYIFVDKALNFSGPPHWTWNSLVGSPTYFIELLSYQKDLKQIFENSTLDVYLNLNYRPFVQGYKGSQLMIYGNSKLSNISVYQWSLGISGLKNWGFGPSSLIQAINTTSNGYIINTTKNQGDMLIQFNNNTKGGYLIATTAGLMNNSGLNANSIPIHISNGMYSFSYTVKYSGPAASGAYVSLFGLNTSLNYVWGMPVYSSVSSRTQTNPNIETLTVNFNPYLINSTTHYLTLGIAFQHYLSAPMKSTLIFSNFTLNAIAPSEPNPMLSPLIPYQLVRGFGLNETAVIPVTLNSMPDLYGMNSSAINEVTYVDSTVQNLSNNHPRSYIFLMSNVFHTTDPIAFTPTPDGIGGVSITNLNLSVEGYLSSIPLISNDIFIKMSGKGNITLTISSNDDITQNNTITVDSSYLKWYPVPVNSSPDLAKIIIKWNGNLSVNSIFETNLVRTSLDVNMNYSGSVRDHSPNLWSFVGSALNKITVIFLSQSYYPDWVLVHNGHSVASTLGFGWGNLFNVPEHTSLNNQQWNFTIYFQQETTRIQMIVIQSVSWIVWGILLLIVASHSIIGITLERRSNSFLRRLRKFKKS